MYYIKNFISCTRLLQTIFYYTRNKKKEIKANNTYTVQLVLHIIQAIFQVFDEYSNVKNDI